ncbi:MAG: hypothetical protein IJU76_15335 [Desulfovibrionaceae bacterium]|nr:hypothetical protein [Desulfovibrionaceae bacterium]
MDYLWTDYARERIYEINDRPGYPYEERDPYPGKGAIGINPTKRFLHIFLPLLEFFLNRENEQGMAREDDRCRRSLENVLLHVLAQIDRCCGLHAFSLQEDVLEQAINRGEYGTDIAKAMVVLTVEEKRSILHLLRRQEEEDGRRLFYREALQVLFPGTHAYFDSDEQCFLLCLPVSESDRGRKRLTLLEMLFSDITEGPKRILWGQHFVVLGKAKDACLDKAVVY